MFQPATQKSAENLTNATEKVKNPFLRIIIYSYRIAIVTLCIVIAYLGREERKEKLEYKAKLDVCEKANVQWKLDEIDRLRLENQRMDERQRMQDSLDRDVREAINKIQKKITP